MGIEGVERDEPKAEGRLFDRRPAEHNTDCS